MKFMDGYGQLDEMEEMRKDYMEKNKNSNRWRRTL